VIERDAIDQALSVAGKFKSNADISTPIEPIPGENRQNFKVSIEGIEASKYLFFKELALVLSIDS
jgi:hypothetical protein